LREAFPENKQKVKKLGVALFEEVSGVHNYCEINSRKQSSKSKLCCSLCSLSIPSPPPLVQKDWNLLGVGWGLEDHKKISLI